MQKVYNFCLTDNIDSVTQDHPMNLYLLLACTAPHLHLATDKVIT